MISLFGLINNKNSAIAEFGRGIRSRKGGTVAIKVMARKLAILFRKLLMEVTDYVKKSAENYREKLREKKEKNLMKIARQLNFHIIEI